MLVEVDIMTELKYIATSMEKCGNHQTIPEKYIIYQKVRKAFTVGGDNLYNFSIE